MTNRPLDQIVATYDFEDDDATDAAGLGEFIAGTMNDKAQISDDEFVVYVYDDQGNAAKSAQFVRQTLTDGSTVVELTIKFDRPK